MTSRVPPSLDGVSMIPGRVFSLRRPGSIWLVEAGELDIFFAREEHGEPAGALRYVCRLGMGDAAFSLPSDLPLGLALFASPSPGSSVNSLGEEHIPPDRVVELAARWRKAVGAAEESAAVETLAQFHRRIIDALHRLQVAEVQGEQRQLNARVVADGRAVDQALITLSGSLAPVSPPFDRAVNPLARACQEIGRAAGITFKIPRSVLLGTARDPVRAVARHSFVRTRKLVLKGEWWRQDSGPMLAYLEERNEPVALLRRAGGYDLVNPADFSTTRINRKTAATLSGIAHVFYRPFPARVIGWKDVLSAGLFGSARDVWTILITGLLASLLSLIAPYATGILFDTIIPGSERNQLTQCIALIVAAAVATALIGLTHSYALLRVEGKMDFVTQAAVWDRLLHMPVTFFRSFSAGDLAYRSLAISQVRAILTGHTLTAILSGIFSLTAVGLIAWYSPMLAGLVSALSGLTVLVTIGSSLMQLKYRRDVSRSTGAIASMVFEFIEGIAKFRVSGSEDRAFARWATAFAGQKQVYGALQRLSNLVAVFTAVFPMVCGGLIYYAVAARMQQSGGGISTGDFFAFSAAFSQLLASVFGLNAGITALFSTIPLYERANPILLTAPEIGGNRSDPGDLRGGIEMNHASFRYGDDSPLVLRDVSFSIKPGEFVAFTGASGSGKSTILRLLLGFEQPVSGAIYYDGQDLAGLDLEEVRRQMGVVLQSGKLLPGDILSNIIGDSPLTIDDAWEAARIAGIEEEIKALPMGMYTMIGEGGKTLSGGQRQRLMIARAVVRRPRILLFDEATSALDNRAQDAVSRALAGMSATRIVVAHRLSTIVNANRIFVLDHGVIAETGTYHELLQKNGLFVDLARRQLA